MPKLTSFLMIFSSLLFLIAVSGQSSAANRPSKKIIGYGWDFIAVNPENLKQHIEDLNKSPFDGIAFSFDVKSDRPGTTANICTALNSWKWDRSWFDSTVFDLKAISKQSPKMKNSFLMIMLATGERGKWADDKFWDDAATNFGIVAYMAKQSGMKGIFLDPEAYSNPPWYEYDPAQGDWDTQRQLARKRGAQIMSAMAKEYPSITVLSFMFMSTYTAYIHDEDDPVALDQAKRWLMPAFMNGMLDALPRKAKLVDGVESGYLLTGNKFETKYKVIRDQVLPLIAPENRKKYASQLQVGFGQYVDCYTNPEGTPYYYFGPLPGGTRVDTFMKTLSHALNVSDEYVWVYGEKGCWWNFDNPKDTRWTNMPLWETLLPGVTEGIRKIDRNKPEGKL